MPESLPDLSIIRSFADALPDQVKLKGADLEEPSGKTMRAGNLTAEWITGTLRYIKAGNRELLRMIYPVLRDMNWRPVIPVVENEEITSGDNSFLIRFRCRYLANDIDFVSDYSIEGRADNTIIATMDGEARENFRKNRTGWCILHPVEGYSGKHCMIEHSNGSREQSVFPGTIYPFEVFTNIRALNWNNEGIECRLDFEGDIFEMMDQRNLAIASFKTYSPPLVQPFPSAVGKGTRLAQKITFRAEGEFGELVQIPAYEVIWLSETETFTVPRIGICKKSGQGRILTENEIKTLRAVHFDHYRFDIRLNDPGWQDEADKACAEAHELGLPVEIALFFDDNFEDELEQFGIWYDGEKILIANILLFHISLAVLPDERSGQIIRYLREKNPQINVATGTSSEFLYLNRRRTGDSRNDSVCFSVSGQGLFSDKRTVIENLKTQADIVQSAKSFSGNKKITVSPVNLRGIPSWRSWFPAVQYSDNTLPPEVDRRQMSLFGACWTAISIKYLSEAGADNLTYFETTGERGIIQGDDEPGWPGSFYSTRGMIFPVFHVFRYILGNRNLTGLKSFSTNTEVVDSLVLSEGKHLKIILINFSDKAQSVAMECCTGLMRIRSLCSDCFGDAAGNMRWTGMEKERVIQSKSIFEIDPCSINFIEGWRKH